MSVNPFADWSRAKLADYYGQSPLCGALWGGRRILNVDYTTRTVILEDGSRVPLDTILHTELCAPSKKPTLAERRDERWEARMLRIKSKRWDKHMMFAAGVGYFMAWVWGVILLTILTTWLAKAVIWSIFG